LCRLGLVHADDDGRPNQVRAPHGTDRTDDLATGHRTTGRNWGGKRLRSTRGRWRFRPSTAWRNPKSQPWPVVQSGLRPGGPNWDAWPIPTSIVEPWQPGVQGVAYWFASGPRSSSRKRTHLRGEVAVRLLRKRHLSAPPDRLYAGSRRTELPGRGPGAEGPGMEMMGRTRPPTPPPLG